MEGVEGESLGFGDRGRYGESGAHAAPAGRAQQVGARLHDGAEDLGRVCVDGLAAGCGGDDTAAQADQSCPETVGVHLRGKDDGALLGDLEAVRGPAL